jgi:general secretion pathway protein F
MPVYKYRGYDSQGSETEGIIEADGQKDASIKVRDQGIFLKEIIESSFSRRGFTLRRPSRFPLSTVTRRLSLLLSSGIPLIDAVHSLSSEQKGSWRDILLDIKEQLSAGSSLARSMQKHAIFPDFYTGMIAAGERSGELSEVLLRLADYLESEAKTRNKVQSALIYPVFMASVSSLIVIFLFTFVVPKITLIFEGSSAPLPLITSILIWITDAFQRFWLAIPIVVFSSLAIFRKFKDTQREILDSLLLKEPFGILMSLYMLRFSLTMSFLLSGGLPILNAMELTADVTGNIRLKKRILSARERVSQGARLSASLEGFPPTLLQLLSTGERSGSLPEVLRKTAASYEDEFDRKLQRAIGLLEPSLILLMGLVVGFIVLAVLLPVFELNQLIR